VSERLQQERKKEDREHTNFPDLLSGFPESLNVAQRFSIGGGGERHTLWPCQRRDEPVWSTLATQALHLQTASLTTFCQVTQQPNDAHEPQIAVIVVALLRVAVCLGCTQRVSAHTQRLSQLS
jgi:hypothetical protein